jgi:hypothetical protein
MFGTEGSQRLRASWFPAFSYLWAAILRDFRTFSFTLAGCGISATVAIFQFAVLTSFLSAATVFPRLIDADVWIGGYGVKCFDLPSSISESNAASLLRYFPGATYRRVYVGMVPFESPRGRGIDVSLVGFDGLPLSPSTFTVDRSDTGLLDLSSKDTGAEVGTSAADFVPSDIRIATFLGPPYIVMSPADAAHAMQMPLDMLSFIAFNVPAMTKLDLAARIRAASAQNPQLMIKSGSSFVFDTGAYWLTKTGGGAAIMLACFLASSLMIVFIVNGISRFVQRRHDDIMTMLGFGSSRDDIGRILILVALLFSVGGVVIGLLAAPLLTLAVRPLIPWVAMSLGDFQFAVAMIAICALWGATDSHFEVHRLPLAEIFRT